MMAVVMKSYGLDAKPFPCGHPGKLLSSINEGFSCRKGTSELGMETNEPIV